MDLRHLSDIAGRGRRDAGSIELVALEGRKDFVQALGVRGHFLGVLLEHRVDGAVEEVVDRLAVGVGLHQVGLGAGEEAIVLDGLGGLRGLRGRKAGRAAGRNLWDLEVLLGHL